MNRQKSFLLFIIATIVVLGIGLFIPPLISAIVSSVYFIAVTLWKPKWIIPLLLLYFPFRPFLVEINTGLKLAGDLAILVLVVIVTWKAIKERDWKSIFKLEIYEWAYLLFCLVGAVSALNTGVSLTAIIFQLRKFLTMYLLYYGLKRLSWDDKDILLYAKVVVSVGMVLSFHGFIEKLSQRNLLLPQPWKEQFVSQANADRIYGLIANPNSMGLYMIIAIIATFVLLRGTKQKGWYVPLALFIGTMFLTFSRGTILGFIVAGLLYLVLAKNVKIIKQLLLSVIAGYVLVFLPIDYADQALEDLGVEQSEGVKGKEKEEEGGIGGRFSNSFGEETLDRSANSGRIFYVKKGFEIFMDYPIIGTGFGTFGDSAALVYSSPIYDDYGLEEIYYYMDKDFYSDNQYIQIIVQTGAVGVVLFAVFLLNMVFRIWKIRASHFSPANIGIALWLFVSMVALVYNVWENQVFPMFFFAIVAWLETLRQGKSKPVS